MRTLRGALVGCGMISEFHLRGWAAIPEVEVVALVDPSAEAAERQRRRFAPRARVYTSLEHALTAETLDFVDVLSPPWLHVEHALLARAAGLHVACQKPISDDLGAARDLVAAFADGPERLSIHENHVLRPWFRDAVGRHRAGEFGDVYRLRLEQYDPGSPPQATNRESAQGVLGNYGIHLLDMVRHLLGPPESVDARTWHPNPEVRGESAASVRLTYASAVATVDVGWKRAGLPQGGLLLLGDRGEAEYSGTMTRGEPSRMRVVDGDEVVLDEVRSPTDDYVASFAAWELAFAHALLNDAPLPTPAAENLVTLCITHAAYASAERGSPVDFAGFCDDHGIDSARLTEP